MSSLKGLLLATLVALQPFLAGTVSAADEGGLETREVRFDSQGKARLSGRVQGRQSIDFVLTATAGQLLTVSFLASHRAAYFNILRRGEEAALFIGSTQGNEFGGRLPEASEYVIRVYLMRSAARRNEKSTFELSTSLRSKEAVPAFDRTLAWQGARFQVTSANTGVPNLVRVAPSGLLSDNAVQEREVAGIVTGAEVADLNADGSPEVYVYVASMDDSAQGSLLAFSANRGRSLSDIVLPPLKATPGASAGYRGHDEFAVLEGVLGRRFPIHDKAGQPTGRMRQLQYRLVPGEAAWRLRVERVLSF